MNRMGFAGAVGALTMALLVPASVSAGAAPAPMFWAEVPKAACTNYKGKHGFGRVVLHMRGFALNNVADAPTPNYIIVTGRYEQKIDGVWVKGGISSATSPTYPDGHQYTFQGMLGQAMRFESADHPLTRMVMRVEFFDDLPTGDVRLGKFTARTAAC